MAFTDTPAWREAQALWRAGRYWEVHEALEPLWHEAQGAERAFLQGVILLAAALHKARTSPTGGRRNYAKALRHLAPLPDVFHGVQVRALELEVHRALLDPGYTPCLPTVDFPS
ncbi:DUF309 domain-containing protein [Marinithermus hydrothermalis]|uniref:DUF309 domain-containing protein n=1 Tax=Marinithermus hydrothermalis (strain DSM 14884 / JCM 11576 / T1) TaxID=869210 RepID=F2NKX5_MARHT|nr:DUF309 domain-containing protein [Marinithermus hydrothermalis]AEB11164.1 protein of unknown function DUF309 [Marinithermus hydrothermalis DSM 14884]